MSDIRDYIKYITKNPEALTTNPPIRIYIKRINNRLVFRTKDKCKVEYKHLTPWNYFVAQKRLRKKTKNGENVPCLEVVKVYSFQCNLADNQYQQKSEVLCTCTTSKFYANLLNVEPNN